MTYKILFKMDFKIGNGLTYFKLIERPNSYIYEKHFCRSVEQTEFKKCEFSKEEVWDEVIRRVREVTIGGKNNAE